MEIRSATDANGVQVRASEKNIPSTEGVQAEFQQERNYNKAEIDKEIVHLNKWLESKDSHLHFVLHDKLNEYYVQVVNNDTNEVMKEIPSKKVMDLVANLYEKLGFIVDKKI